MEVKTIIIPYSRGEKFRGHALGDEHEGTQHHAESMLATQVKEIASDKVHNFWWGMADKCEFITPSDPRWDAGSIESWVQPDNIAVCQSDHWMDTHMPIQDQCKGLLWGNHEDAIRIHSHVDVQYNICQKFGVENLGYSCFLRLIFRRRKSKESHQFIGFVTHGSGWAVTKGAKLNRLQRIMNDFDADFYAHGHMHDLIDDKKPYLQLNANNVIVQKEKVGAVTGCWFRTYTQGVSASYGEKKTYSPTSIGCAVFTFDPSNQEVTVET